MLLGAGERGESGQGPGAFIKWGAKKPPKLPAPGKAFDPRAIEKTESNMLDSVMVLTHPAQSAWSTRATNRLSIVAIANGLGNERPERALAQFSDDNEYLFIMPVIDHAKAIQISYDGDQSAIINLRKVFTSIHRTATKGMREYYSVEATDEPVTIEDETGFALWSHLVAIDEQPIKPRPRKPKEKEKAQNETK